MCNERGEGGRERRKRGVIKEGDRKERKKEGRKEGKRDGIEEGMKRLHTFVCLCV